MTNQEQAFVEGFIKRADERGLNYGEAISLFKQAAMNKAPSMAVAPPPAPAVPNPVAPITPGLHLSNTAPQAATAPPQPAPQARPLPSAVPPSEQLIFETPGERTAPKRSIDYYAPVQSTPAPVAQPAPQPAAPGTQQYGGISWPKETARFAQPQAKPLQSAVQAEDQQFLNTPQPNRGESLYRQNADEQLLNAPPSAGGTPVYQQRVNNQTLKRIMGSYNPNSRMDRAKADAIRQLYSPGMKSQEIYNNPAYQAAMRRA